MYYKILFLLTCFKFYQDIKRYMAESKLLKDGDCVMLSRSTIISYSMTALFYFMVLALCALPTILF